MKRRWPYVIAVTLLATGSRLDAQELQTGDPSKLGFSAERLARIGQVFSEHVEAGRIAGAEGMILRRGQIAYHQVWGFRDLAARDPLEENDIFHICSMTKPITSVAVMMLWEEGRFALSDPIARYIPALANLRVAKLQPGSTTATLETEPPRRPVTIEDLLRHTSGLTYGLFANTVVDSLYRAANLLAASSLDGMVSSVAELPLVVQPGTRWIYSVSADVLGKLVEAVSGTAFDEFLRTRLFTPLAMYDTDFRIADANRSRASLSYRHAGANADLALNPRDACEAPFPSGGAGLTSTAHDYARFAQMMINGGELNGTRLLAPATVRLMSTDHLGDIPGPRPGWGFGLGFAVKEAPTSVPSSLGTYYWEGLEGTYFWIDPAEELIGVFMVQIYPNRSTDFKAQFEQLVYSAIVR